MEIADAQHRALSAVAQRRGLRGFSQLVQEALDAYLRDLDAGEIDMLLGLEASSMRRSERCGGGSLKPGPRGGPRSS